MFGRGFQWDEGETGFGLLASACGLIPQVCIGRICDTKFSTNILKKCQTYVVICFFPHHFVAYRLVSIPNLVLFLGTAPPAGNAVVEGLCHGFQPAKTEGCKRNNTGTHNL